MARDYSLTWHESHLPYDWSYHGSPQYECELCKAAQWTEEAHAPCPKREAHDKRKEEQRIQAEQLEWKQLKARRAREKYLEETYGK